MNQSFGQLLKHIRREKGVSQRDLADQVGVDFSYISKIENDRMPPPSADTSAWAAPFTCRDSAMAENVQWALKSEGPGGRLLVFAHDAHVMNWKDDEPRWAAVRDKPSMMGSHLRRMYGEDVYIIATSFATASTALRTSKPEEDGLDRTLAGLGLPLIVSRPVCRPQKFLPPA